MHQVSVVSTMKSGWDNNDLLTRRTMVHVDTSVTVNLEPK